MKKFALAGLVAVSMLAISEQQASAWINSRFSVGLNWNMQSGGNQWLWGAWRNGQPPGPEAWGQGHYPHYASMPQFYGPPHGGYYGSAPMAQPYAAQGSLAPFVQYYASPYQFANYARPSYYYYYPDTFYFYAQ